MTRISVQTYHISVKNFTHITFKLIPRSKVIYSQRLKHQSLMMTRLSKYGHNFYDFIMIEWVCIWALKFTVRRYSRVFVHVYHNSQSINHKTHNEYEVGWSVCVCVFGNRKYRNRWWVTFRVKSFHWVKIGEVCGRFNLFDVNSIRREEEVLVMMIVWCNAMKPQKVLKVFFRFFSFSVDKLTSTTIFSFWLFRQDTHTFVERHLSQIHIILKFDFLVTHLLWMDNFFLGNLLYFCVDVVGRCVYDFDE